jgi:hypothetical protein
MCDFRLNSVNRKNRLHENEAGFHKYKALIQVEFRRLF